MHSAHRSNRRKIIVVFFVLFLMLVFACSCFISFPQKKVSKYSPESEIYKTVLTRMFGTWEADEFYVKLDTLDQNFLGTEYEKVEMTIAPSSDGERKIELKLFLKKEDLEAKLADWKAKWPDLQIDTYAIQILGKWGISDSGDIFYIDDIAFSLIIEGKGSNIEGFKGWEMMQFQGKMAAVPNLKYPKIIEDQYNFKLDENDTRLELISHVFGYKRFIFHKVN